MIQQECSTFVAIANEHAARFVHLLCIIKVLEQLTATQLIYSSRFDFKMVHIVLALVRSLSAKPMQCLAVAIELIGRYIQPNLDELIG